MGRQSVTKLKGDLRPVYRQLQRLMPRHRASASWERLSEGLNQLLHPGRKSELQSSNVQRELGGGLSGGVHVIHEAYFEAFKSLFCLPALGVTDDILLHPVDSEREVLISSAIGKRPFDWISAQAQDEDAGRLDMIRVDHKRGASGAMGPASSLFEPLPTDAKLQAPIGRRFRFQIDMPLEGYVTILSQDPTTVFVDGERYQPTFSLDSLAGCLDCVFPSGRTTLPGELRMEPPPGLTRTAMIAAPAPFRFPWDSTKLKQLHPVELNRFMGDLVARGAQGFRVTTLVYQVVE